MESRRKSWQPRQIRSSYSTPQSFQTDPIRIYGLIYNRRATMEIVSGYLLSVSYINLSIALTILLLLQLFRGLTNKANILNSFLLSRVLILRFLFMAYGCLRWLRRATAFPPRCHYERFYGAAYVKIDRYSYIHIYICMYICAYAAGRVILRTPVRARQLCTWTSERPLEKCRRSIATDRLSPPNIISLPLFSTPNK